MTNEQLIEELMELGYLKSPNLQEAFRDVLREKFLPKELQAQAYENTPLPIGDGQTTSQPLVIACMLELLQIQAGDRILEIGSGSGWQSALLAYAGAEVISMECIPRLHESAKEHIQAYPELAQHILFIQGDGSKGYEQKAPFEKIIACAAVEEIPQQWRDQVKIGGRIVCPMDERIVMLEKTGKNEFTKKEYFGFRFVPLQKE